jgi:diguanylate cyclase (GGDEF)-like protein
MARILIVDDHALNRQFLVTLLGYRDHVLYEAGDGAEALAVVRDKHPDLVITDILMPTMDGYEFVRRLRADGSVASTTVVFYTAHYHKEEAQQLAASCGVADILTKPCEPGLILRTVEELIARPAAAVAAPSSDFEHDHVRVITDKLSQTADELGIANQRLGALVEIGLQLASEREPRKLFNEVCRAARDLLGARYGILAVGNRNDGRDVYFVTSGLAEDSSSTLQAPLLKDGLLGNVYAQRKPQRVVAKEGVVPSSGLPEGFPPVSSLLAAPVVSLAHVYGWICLTNKVGASEFSEEDERLLAILGAQVGRIFENGSLYVEVENHARDLSAEIQQRKAAQKRVERLNRVHAVLSGINTLTVRERNRQQLFNEVCRIAVEHGHFGIAWVDRLGADSEEPAATAAGGADARPEDMHKALAPVERSLDAVLDRAIDSRKPCFDNDMQAGAELPRRLTTAIGRGYRSRIVLPLLVDGRVVACLSLLAGELDFFTTDEVKLLRELADNISFALAHIEKEEQLIYLAFFDELTRLPNRSLFLDRIEQHMRVNNGAAPAGLVLLDIERFRMVNESLGSADGDMLLRQVAERLEHAYRGKDNLARVSANGYGVLLREIRDAGDVAQAVENKILACFADAYSVGGTELRVSAKAGIAFHPGDGDDAGVLFRNAEAALKRAKKSGDRYVFYAAEMNAQAAQALSLETRIRKAIEERQFVLHYQPKYDLASNELCGLEALIRWQDPESGLVPPGLFIPLLEETGLILDVGRWTMGQALEDYCDWSSRGLVAPRIAINVSAIELQQRRYMDNVIEAVQAAGDVPEALELEITESVMMQDVKRNVRALDTLRGLGITVAIDDFGTGYSSLSHIARLPIDRVKIDRSFVGGMIGNKQDLMVASITIVLAHSLGVRVVAEGVETEGQLAALKRLKCDEAQGYLFSKPVPKAEIEALLTRRA